MVNLAVKYMYVYVYNLNLEVKMEKSIIVFFERAFWEISQNFFFPLK